MQKFYAVERQREVIRAKPKPAKPKAWSHDDELQAHKGKRLAIVDTDYQRSEAILLEADRFVLKLSFDLPDGSQSVMTVYKHALASYQLLQE